MLSTVLGYRCSRILPKGTALITSPLVDLTRLFKSIDSKCVLLKNFPLSLHTK
jgi:hypothetical protein